MMYIVDIGQMLIEMRQILWVICVKKYENSVLLCLSLWY